MLSSSSEKIKTFFWRFWQMGKKEPCNPEGTFKDGDKNKQNNINISKYFF